MAVVADIEGLDIWVAPHEWTAEEREEVRRFIEEHRKEWITPEVTEKIAQLLAMMRARHESSALVEPDRADQNHLQSKESS